MEGEPEKVPEWAEEPLTDPLADPLSIDEDYSEKVEAEHKDEPPTENSTGNTGYQPAEREGTMDEMITVDDVRFSEHNESDKEETEEKARSEFSANKIGDASEDVEMESHSDNLFENDDGAAGDSVRTPVDDSQRETEHDRESVNDNAATDDVTEKNSNSPENFRYSNEDSNPGSNVGSTSSNDKTSNFHQSEEKRSGSRVENNEDSLDEMESDREQRTGGSDGGDEDDENKTKRLKAKRRHISGAEICAPAPKIKRKCRKEADDDKDKESSKSSKKESKRKEDGRSSDDEEYSSDEDSDSRHRKIRRRSGTSGLSAKPKVKNMRRNIRDIISDDKLEDDTLTAQKEEQLRLQRLQEKRLALREYLEQQQVRPFLPHVTIWYCKMKQR